MTPLGVKLQAITRGPSHHFFGYHDKSPWNEDQILVVARESHVL